MSDSIPVVEEARAVALRNRLIWLTLFRTVATSLSLVAVLIRLGSEGWREPTNTDSLSFGLIVVAYLSTVVYGVMLRRQRVHRGAAVLQVGGDIIIAAALVYVTGGSESPFTFAFSIGVIGAAIVLGQRGALTAAAVCVLVHAALLGALQVGWIERAHGSSPISTGRLFFVLASHCLAVFLIAVLAGYLSRQLMTTSGQLRAREADLRSLSKLQTTILANMPSGLLTADSRGFTTFVNRAARQILEFDGPAEGRNIEEILPGLKSLGSDGKRRELWVPSRVGQRVLGLTTTELDGYQKGILVVFQDLTELRAMEEGLKRADQLAALGRLSAQLAHEIRNPLAALRGSAQLLGQGASEHHKKLTDILIRESDRLGRLVEDFLRFARPPNPRIERVSLSALVEEMIRLVRADPLSNGVEITLSGELVEALADPDQIRQVVLNLLRNAIQVVGARGQVRTNLSREHERAVLRVWDSAGAITAEHMPRIFEPFFSTREGGSGLGLSTAHSIILSHHGSIHVTSSQTLGTEFVVQLPAPRGG